MSYGDSLKVMLVLYVTISTKNCLFQEHQELLQNVVVHEQRMMSKQARLHRLTTGMFSKVTEAEREVGVKGLSDYLYRIMEYVGK